MGLSVFDERIPYLANGNIAAAATPGLVYFALAGPTGTRIDNVLVSTSDSVAVHLEVTVYDGGSTGFPFRVVVIPAGAGRTAGVPAVDLIQALGLLQEGIPLPANTQFQGYLPTALSAGTDLAWTSFGGHY